MIEPVIAYLLGNWFCSTETQYLAFYLDRGDSHTHSQTHSLTSVYMTRLKPRENKTHSVETRTVRNRSDVYLLPRFVITNLTLNCPCYCHSPAQPKPSPSQPQGWVRPGNAIILIKIKIPKKPCALT